MAISIKNHEDRITALEKIGKVVKIYNEGARTFPDNAANDAFEDFDLSDSWRNYDMLIIPCTTQHFANSSMWSEPSHCGVILTSALEMYPDAEWGIINSIGQGGRFETLKVKSLTDRKVRVILGTGGGNISAGEVVPFIAGIKFGLKLYYNFSYNITREFYKVKFKLKHYLCSHLKKFI